MNGIERKIDKLGRVVLPISYRKRLGLSENSSVTISLSDDMIYISASTLSCMMCGNTNNINKSLRLCQSCIDKVKNE